jgi:hypothetical protein
MAEMIGRATVREHLPKQDISCMDTILFISMSFQEAHLPDHTKGRESMACIIMEAEKAMS